MRSNHTIMEVKQDLNVGFEENYSDFIRSNPAYQQTAALDELRATDYGRLDRLDHTYLDYTGGGLYGEGQLTAHFNLLGENVFGNPHSINPTSYAMTTLVDSARAYVLEYFNASPEEYVAIFTLNASGALKLVGESYPFDLKSRFLLTFDNHNSVNGIREFARMKGAAIVYAPISRTDMRIDRGQVADLLGGATRGGNNLFGFPAQSNFSGVQYPLDLVEEAHHAGWDVLLDAAAFAPTNRLDLSRWKPEFVSLSFYKMFGFPTGIGCLLARKSALSKLSRPWFAGGTIKIASIQADGHFLTEGAAAFEDGTINYLAFPGVEVGLRHLASIGIDTIHERVDCLTGWLLGQMMDLRHQNGRPLCKIHGPATSGARGGTIAFNFMDQNGVSFDIRLIEILAHEANISLRTGCFCNPGAGEIAFGVDKGEIEPYFKGGGGLDFDDFRMKFAEENDRDIGAVRISVGLVTNFADVSRFIEFARGFLDQSTTDFASIDLDLAASRITRDSA
jgi:selenocysteine lyase/cysteine desulfurase